MVDVKEYNFDKDVDFISYSSEEEWHELRKDGIGGSDAGAIMGLSKYVSPLKVYRTKKRLYSENVEDNVYIKKGKDLESFIFNKYVVPYMENINYKAIHPEHIFVNKQYPWLRANCDGIAVPQDLRSRTDPSNNIVIEIKWVSEWAEVNWGGDEYEGIPASYYAQVQHYMTVTGARTALVFAIFDRTWEVKMFAIPYSLSFSLRMLHQTSEFHTNLLLGKEPPITATLDKEFMPGALDSSSTETEVSEELDQTIAEYLVAKEALKQSEKELDVLYNKAVQMYLEGKRPTKLYRMKISTCTRAGFDTKRFSVEHPDVYAEYLSASEFPRVTMKKA